MFNLTSFFRNLLRIIFDKKIFVNGRISFFYLQLAKKNATHKEKAYNWAFSLMKMFLKKTIFIKKRKEKYKEK